MEYKQAQYQRKQKRSVENIKRESIYKPVEKKPIKEFYYEEEEEITKKEAREYYKSLHNTKIKGKKGIRNGKRSDFYDELFE